MDEAKCKSLKAELASQPEPQIVPVARFFDGNDDLGSIGCNLIEHPGIEFFRSVLVGLTSHADVMAVYAQISELDAGEDSWPFANQVIVVGQIPIEELNRFVRELQPDEVIVSNGYGVSPSIAQLHQNTPVSVIWWD